MSPEGTTHAAAPAPAPASACFGYERGVWPAVVSPCCSDQANDLHAECTLPGCTCKCHNPNKG